MNIRILFLLTVGIMFFNCTAEPEVLNYTEETIDGVKYIHNLYPKYSDVSDESPPITLEFVRKWGELESEDENYMFYKPYDINMDTNGDVYIVDQGKHRIQKFDGTGKYLLTIGRHGQGPEEFQYPSRIQFGDNKELHVSDGTFAVKSFDKKGNYLDQINFNELKYVKWVRLKSGKLIRKTVEYFESGSVPKFSEYLLEYDDVKNGNLEKIGNYANIDTSGLKKFSKRLHHTLHSNNDYYSASTRNNIISKFDKNFKLVYTMDRVLPYKKSTKAVTDYPFGKDGPRRSVFNFFTYFTAVDHKNRLWVGTYTRPFSKEERTIFWEEKGKVDNRMFEVYDSEGVLLYRIKHDLNLKSSRLKYKFIGDRFFVIDTYNEMAIFEYKIVEAEAESEK